ncbi:hypothetical protein N9M07_03670 [Candidatus Actinomarina sp.]|jgi:hypothetical protein|nr:hypothetical protein [Candidatus Actinomarina sp.]MDA8710593.1 hypothetical protein [Candidatus Actinomarina sp.]MDB2456003.1 hypothetical protein [Candidatus Actinomarina sp.]MDC3275302.1 hypothetical protein [bacterium]
MIKNIFKLKNLYVLIAITALAYGGYYFGTQNTVVSSSSKTLELTTVSIQQGDLSKKEEYNGTLRQTDSKILNSPMSGVVTFIPKEGTIINFGEVLFAVDNKPVILIEGVTPFYRTLDLNSDPGPDILQVEKALVSLGYALEDFVPDEIFDETTSNMLNMLYVDYKIETKSEVTSTEQVAINLKESEVENIESLIKDGGTTLIFVNDKKKKLDDLIENSSISLAELNDKKKKLDDAKDAATEESAAWTIANNLVEDYYVQITLLKDLTNPKTLAKSSTERETEIKAFEDLIEEQKRVRDLEEGKESSINATEALAIETAQKAYDDALKSYNDGINATEALAIETAQKAYDDALKSYNDGIDQAAELSKAKEELEQLRLSSRSETFSPTNAYASKTPIIIGSYINETGSAVVLNSPLYNISSIGIEVVFQVDATDQETVSLGDSVEIELPTDERVPTVITFIDQVVTQTQAGDFIEVTLDVINPESIEVYDQAPVKVFVTTEVSENVLYVPVNALIALAEGGYAVEIFNGDEEGEVFDGDSGTDTTYVAVEIGVFTDGFVEIIGNFQKGQLVVVPR